MTTTINDRERDFHDEWASNTPLEKRNVVLAFEASTAPENRFILEQMGDLKGKRLLDIGCGLGESSVYFAMRGAKVTALDLSPKMVETTVALGKRFGVEIEGVVGSAESLGVESNSFDFVYLANLIHHVHEREKLWLDVRRVLKPGGRFFSWDPIHYNPVINVYRKMASQMRTVDESPLRRVDVRTVKRYFSQVSYRTFWLTTLILFLKYALWDRVSPNTERYWKRILNENEGRLSWFRQLQRLDSLLLRIPGSRWLAWNIVISGQKA
ncbi:MAG: class I SAM-dependent methyltransferase [Deltaproteobacteria bacterium]|nr:class I SAM-dependent methyltransferase [Deltaproteobacteria bacterium]MBI3293204.1 class I SAM-dependent methyltransferase [Deltaproteobacteria bacterium]